MEENVAQLSALANDITENYDDCDDRFLTADIAIETMRVADRVYNFSQRILKDQHLFIFLFQARHRKEDSFCRCMNMTDGGLKQYSRKTNENRMWISPAFVKNARGIFKLLTMV